MPREALLLSCAQQGRSKRLTAEVALLRGHLGVRLHACKGSRSANDLMRASSASGSHRGTLSDGVDPLGPDSEAACGAHPQKQVKSRLGSLNYDVF